MSRDTVKKYVENPHLVGQHTTTRKYSSKLDRFEGIIRDWLNDDSDLRIVQIYEQLRSIGFEGSYDIVRRRIGELNELPRGKPRGIGS